MIFRSKLITPLLLASVLSTAAIADTKSLIPYVSEEDATGEIKEIYTDVKGAFGMLPTPIMQHSVSPDLLKNHWDYFGAISKNKNFSQKFLAIMRMSIATLDVFQHCDYCVDGNAMMLKHMFKMDDKEIQAIQKAPLKTDLEKKDLKMLGFLLTAAKDPKSLTKKSFDQLRNVGWSDKDIFEGLKMATQMIAAIYMVNSLKLPSDFK
jgi:hypothetical protein